MKIEFIFTAIIYVWIGFILAISFMESWLKFRAPGITLALGLGIGRLVFKALNRVEWILFLILAIISYSTIGLNWQNAAIWTVPVILSFQTFYLLPVMDKRAEMRIQGISLSKSYLHVLYVAAEIIKIVALVSTNYLLINSNL